MIDPIRKKTSISFFCHFSSLFLSFSRKFFFVKFSFIVTIKKRSSWRSDVLRMNVSISPMREHVLSDTSTWKILYILCGKGSSAELSWVVAHSNLEEARRRRRNYVKDECLRGIVRTTDFTQDKKKPHWNQFREKARLSLSLSGKEIRFLRSIEDRA